MRTAGITTRTRSRDIEHIVQGIATSDGAGVKLRRYLTRELQQRLDPFLMLDAFRSDNPGDYIAGFPDHPHRGFETITYMLAGRMRHRDNTGNEGLLEAGDVQWMTAGRGIVHSEIPEQEQGLMDGFQLWLNLPAEDKLCAPGYRDIPADAIPLHSFGDSHHARVIAGHWAGVAGAVTRPRTEPLILHLQLAAGVNEFIDIPQGHNAFLFAIRGSATIGEVPRTLPARCMAILDNSDAAAGVRIASDEAVELLLVAGRPLRETIAQWGPFVMNTREQLMQAVEDYQQGRFY